MKKSEIKIEVDLDEQNVPERLFWEASESPESGSEIKALALSLWDGKGEGTLKIDLWTKEMEVTEMKRFFIETISGMADTIRNATQDELMAMDMQNLCDSLSRRLEQEMKTASKPQ